MSTQALWLAIVGAGAVTFALRLSFIALLGRIEIPLFCRRVLRFVPAAVLTAFVIPLLFYENGALHVSIDNERLLSGLIAVIIGWRTKSILFTLVGHGNPVDTSGYWTQPPTAELARSGAQAEPVRRAHSVPRGYKAATVFLTIASSERNLTQLPRSP